MLTLVILRLLFDFLQYILHTLHRVFTAEKITFRQCRKVLIAILGYSFVFSLLIKFFTFSRLVSSSSPNFEMRFILRR